MSNYDILMIDVLEIIMWDRKELKSNSKKSLRKNYGRTIAVCFILVFLTAAFTTSTRLITSYSPDEKLSKNAIEVMGIQSTAYAVGKLYEDIQLENPTQPKDLIDIETIEKIADATLDPNSAAVNTIKIADVLVIDGLTGAVFFLIVGFLLKLLYNIFISSSLYIGNQRFFLENRRYSNTGIHKIFCLFWFKHFIHPAMVMLVRWVKLTLWSLTIVGGVYKRYEYMMVPFILAENPETPTKAAFKVSKEMMMGNKWNAFLLDVSFLGWELLNFVTIGLLNVFYVNAYKGGTYAELYMTLRNKAIEDSAPYSVYYIDTYLEPSEEFLAAHGNTYPYEHYMFPPKEYGPINADRKYDLTSYILFFFIFSFVGWCFEVGMHLVGDGVFVNRGTMHGPWLPIFGSGGLFVLIFMRKTLDKPIFTFFTIAGVCSLIEYVVSVYLEAKMGIRWWDYSEYFMNFQGRICLYGALVFGFGGCGFLYYIAPIMDNQLRKIPMWAKVVTCMALITIFLADVYISINNPNMGAGITDYELQ